jgi:TP901 family phage tail tape measure protein
MSRADVKAGAAYVSLYTKSDALTRGLQKAKADLNSFGSDMLSLGSRMVAMSAAIATPLAFATKTFAGFDDAMRAVGAVTNSTAAELESMTTVAKELGRTTSFTAVQVAQLMTELGRAGFKPDQVNAMTGAVLSLARATGTDATLSSQIMAAAIRQFNLEATDAARVADVLTLAANSTFNTVEGLGESLKYAGPVAKSLGMSLEDTVAILGSLGNVGIQGSEAGTALRRLGVISAATGKELKATFGISNVDAAGNLKPLVQIMAEIGVAVENLPVAERVEKMNSAFGLLGITSAQVLTNTAGDTMALADALKNAAGTADKAAASMDAGLGGSFRIIMSAAEGLQIALGKALSGSIDGVTKTITGLIGKATEWVEKNQGVIVSLASVAAGAAAAGVAIISIGIAAKASAVAVGLMAAAFGATKSVLMAAAIAVKLFAAASMAASWAIYGVTIATVALSQGASVSAVAAGVMSAAWASAGAVISSVWAVITAPAFPFIAAGTAAVAVVGALAAAAGYAALRGVDFSAAWGTAVGALKELMAVAQRVGGILMDALAGGDYDIAMASVFQGIKLALATTVEGMGQLWTQFWDGAWEVAKKFFIKFAQLAAKTVLSVAIALANPSQGAAQLMTTIASIGQAGLSINIDTSSMRSDATAEIDRLEKELEARKAKREAEREAKEKAAAAAAGGDTPAGAGAGGDGVPVGDATEVSDELEEASKAAKSAFDRETEALQQQIIALRQGEEAAERFRLAKMGLNDAEIGRIMGLREEQKELEKQQEASQRKVRMIQEFADADYKKNKLTPEQIAAKEKEAIERARQRGAIDDKTAAEAMAQADIRRAELEHQERLKKFMGEDADGKGATVKSGAASSATFSGADLLAMGSGSAANGQLQATLGTKKAIEMQTKQQKELHTAQLTALTNLGLHHA